MSGRLNFSPAERAEHRDSSRCEATREEDGAGGCCVPDPRDQCARALPLDLRVCRARDRVEYPASVYRIQAVHPRTAIYRGTIAYARRPRDRAGQGLTRACAAGPVTRFALRHNTCPPVRSTLTAVMRVKTGRRRRVTRMKVR